MLTELGVFPFYGYKPFGLEREICTELVYLPLFKTFE